MEATTPTSAPASPADKAAKAVELVRKRNIENIVRKVADGGTLTRDEQAQLDAYLAAEAQAKAAQNSSRVNALEEEDDAGISRRDARKLWRANLAALRYKLEVKKQPLTASEAAMVQSAMEEVGGSPSVNATGWVQSQVELAEILGVTRKTIQRHLKRGAPKAESDGRYNVVLWKRWMKDNGHQFKEDDASEEKLPSRTAVEVKRIMLANEKLETELAILRGEYSKNEDIERMLVALVAEARKVILQAPPALAPQVVGLAVPEAEKRIRATMDEVMEVLHSAPVRYAAAKKQNAVNMVTRDGTNGSNT